MAQAPGHGPQDHEDYGDRWITCTATELRIRGYYFPWGTKRIPYSSIRSVTRVEMGHWSGQWRIWGTSNPRYWASFDPDRPKKTVGLILNVGRSVQPFITPDDPDTVEALVRRRAGLPPGEEGDRKGTMV